MTVSELSASTQDYLKVIWGASEWSGAPVTTSIIAEKLNLRLSSVSDALKRLKTQGLIDHTPYGAITLTESGRRNALAMVRRHRLIETFLVGVLGYDWDEVHDEAENLEHAVSEMMVERIDALLGHPTRDPHGDPIPSESGEITHPSARILTEFRPGDRVRVERISDADPALLQYFAAHGLRVDAELRILPADPYAEALTLEVAGQTDALTLGAAATSAIWVSVL